ncbi:hypothetical protein ACIP66_03075 [Pseudomonas sp. NPDC088429]|uniref:hypothetical protein n=1 Tax=Pseudomonas sp. NPDC088429 TaxID=3364455 RepID=UPI0037F5F9B2
MNAQNLDNGADSVERLTALHSYEILDTPREDDFDELVNLAASICDAPISVVNLIDSHRQWFKAEVGLGISETPLDASIGLRIIKSLTNQLRGEFSIVNGHPGVQCLLSFPND